jgi:DNA-binding PadR family transcriptional regulator
MVMNNPSSTLAFALLGLLWQQPRSGYDLRKFFSSTPMISFSDSPGAIYPALRRLELHGLVRGHVEERPSLRRRKVFQITARGRAEFRRWQTQPITRNDVIRNLDTLLLRFAFMDPFAREGTAVRFLKNLHNELAAYLPILRKYFRSNREHMPQSGRQARSRKRHPEL